MELTAEDRKLLLKLEEWNNYNTQVCDIQDAVNVLMDKNPKAHTWSINFLMCDLVKAAEDRQDAFHELEKLGVKEYDDAILLAAKYLKD